jgi:hypothetical protein
MVGSRYIGVRLMCQVRSRTTRHSGLCPLPQWRRVGEIRRSRLFKQFDGGQPETQSRAIPHPSHTTRRMGIRLRPVWATARQARKSESRSSGFWSPVDSTGVPTPKLILIPGPKRRDSVRDDQLLVRGREEFAAETAALQKVAPFARSAGGGAADKRQPPFGGILRRSSLDRLRMTANGVATEG